MPVRCSTKVVIRSCLVILSLCGWLGSFPSSILFKVSIGSSCKIDDVDGTKKGTIGPSAVESNFFLLGEEFSILKNTQKNTVGRSKYKGTGGRDRSPTKKCQPSWQTPHPPLLLFFLLFLLKVEFFLHEFNTSFVTLALQVILCYLPQGCVVVGWESLVRHFLPQCIYKMKF